MTFANISKDEPFEHAGWAMEYVREDCLGITELWQRGDEYAQMVIFYAIPFILFKDEMSAMELFNAVSRLKRRNNKRNPWRHIIGIYGDDDTTRAYKLYYYGEPPIILRDVNRVSWPSLEER